MMKISFKQDRTAYKPGGTVHGTVEWELVNTPRKLELRLFWRTEGRGSQDIGVAATALLQSSGRRGREDFSFALPLAPYSFSGRLISLIWGLELDSDQPEETARADIIVSPSLEEIVLPAL